MWDSLNIMDVAGSAALFGLLSSAVLMLGLVYNLRRSRRRDKLAQRLGLSAPREAGTRQIALWHDGMRVSTTVPAGGKPSLRQRLALLKRDANLKTSLALLTLLLALLSASAFGLVYTLSKNLLLSGVAAAGVLMAVWFVIASRVDRRRALFEAQLVDALQLGARSLRAGHPLLGAFQLIADDLDDPIRSSFAQVCQQQEMGFSLDTALDRVSRESNSVDFKLFATSVSIQLKAGGNLADMMERVATVIRERIKLSRRVRVITAQTQFSKRILLAIPFVLFLVLHVVRPDYMAVFQATTVGRLLLGAAAGGLLLGAYIMNRMVRVEW